MIHHDRFCKLFANVNVLHKRDFNITIFHVKKNKNDFIKTNIEFIFFFNKILIFAKFKYWFIELKIAKLIWLIKKIRHIIETLNSTLQITIYIDHFVIINIIKQIKLSFFNIDKFNLKLIQTFIYLFQFRLNVRHKFKKQHIMSNALFKLFSSTNIANFTKQFFDFSKDILNITYHVKIANFTKPFSNISTVILNMIHHVTLIKMSQNFKFKFKNVYKQNKRWTKILNLFKSKSFSTNNQNSITFIKNFIKNQKHKNLSNNNLIIINNSVNSIDDFTISINNFDIFNETFFVSAENLRFRYKNDLLYYVNEFNDEKKRLCIFKKLVDEIFVLIHDKLNHVEYHKTHNEIIASFYIRKLVKQLRVYVIHCFQCQIHQITRHKFYENFLSIQSSTIFFHIITINFIVTLFVIITNYNVVFTITCKFFKRVLLIFKKSNWFANKWIVAFLVAFMNYDWNVLCDMIFDQNSKFMSNFWRNIFKHLKIQFLMFITWHAQTND